MTQKYTSLLYNVVIIFEEVHTVELYSFYIVMTDVVTSSNFTDQSCRHSLLSTLLVWLTYHVSEFPM